MKPIGDKVLIMGSNLHAGSMQQSRHNLFLAGSLLNEKIGEKVSLIGLPSQQGIDNKSDDRDRVVICFIPWN